MARRDENPQQNLLFGDKPVRVPDPVRRVPPPPGPDDVVMDGEPGAEDEKVERCEACGQTIKKLNPHRMDASKVRVLLDIALLEERRRHRIQAQDQGEGGQPWVLAKEGDELQVLSHDGTKLIDARTTAYRARAHASRLQWFGLLEYGGPRTGAWRLNECGYAFIAGTLAVPPRIWCREGEVIEREEGGVTINDVEDVVLSAEYWDGYAEWQSYRGEG